VRTLDAPATPGGPRPFLAPADADADRYAPVRLAEVVPELLSGVSDAELVGAGRYLVAPGLPIAQGPWTPPARLGKAIALLVVDGFLVLDSSSAGLPDVRLFGADDLVDGRLLASPATAWRALTTVRVAALDARLLAAGRRWPHVTLALTRLIFDAHEEQARLAAIRALPHVEDRIMAYMSHLGSRWGRVTPQGVVIALPASHELLGRLVAARRPTVSLALTSLNAQGRLGRLPDGRWLLGRAAADPAQRAA
jgi:CRP/FNR family cyclic AMP-dependent transcriptional regulator